MQRSENAMGKSGGRIGSEALKSLRAFNKQTAEKLFRRINSFSNLLKKTTDPKKRCQITRWIADWRAEQRSLFHGWKNSRIRSDMAEDFPATMRGMDEVLSGFEREARSDVKLNRQREIDRKYRLAGRIINRNKVTSLCG